MWGPFNKERLIKVVAQRIQIGVQASASMSALKSWLSKSYSDTGRVIAKTHIEGSAGTLVMRPSAARIRIVGPERDDDEHDDRDHRRPERRTPSRRDTVEQRHGAVRRFGAPPLLGLEAGAGASAARGAGRDRSGVGAGDHARSSGSGAPILPGPVGIRASERVLELGVQELDVVRRPRLLDVRAGEEVAVAEEAIEVSIELVRHGDVDLLPDLA